MEIAVVDSAIADELVRKKQVGAAREKTQGRMRKEGGAVAVDGESPTNSAEDQQAPAIQLSMFDSSIENHFKAIDTIARLCGEPEGDAFDDTEIERLSCKITFLREWRYFNYKPRAIRFAYEMGSPQGKDVIGGINLTQFSSATVPHGRLSLDKPASEFSNDFVLYVGGPVWALDWCPRVHQRSESQIKCEFIAVAAHPPDSSYHKLGVPLSGRGLIQIWCLLNVTAEMEEVQLPTNKRRGRPKRIPDIKEKLTEPKRPRGRPRKNPNELKRPRGRPRKKPVNENDQIYEQQFVQALSVELSKNSSDLDVVDQVSFNALEHAAQKQSGRKRKDPGQVASESKNKTKMQCFNDGNCLPLLMQNGDQEASVSNLESSYSFGQDPMISSRNAENNFSLEICSAECSIPKDLALPRIMLCLAHNGKVAWDVKWRPCNLNDSECKPRMGYLAVLLGNGSLEVWEVPSPCTMKLLYSSHAEGTDPRFVKLEPVFRCSKLKNGDKQSIPLTLEWSVSFPYDLILAGCHDGTVALWKFCTGDSSKDTRPLLCFSADTVPIRALAWAPVENDPDSANVIATAGHEGLKFWDIRDPFRPLWDLNPVRRIIYSLDWLPNPRCVILSFDDGTLRVLSLAKAACDIPVTGKPFVGTQQQGLSSYYCSSFSIWSVQVSRRTGMVAYCSADGSVLHFQLTNKAVEKNPSRYRAPHFLCGSLTEEDSALTVNTPLPGTPFPMKQSLNEWGNTPRTIRGFIYESNQAKRASELKGNGQNSDQPLALCYGDDAGKEFESEDMLVGPEKMPMKETKMEVFPPKIVAMHRVRWNMNKGSGRWLCSGGAAGILRCQEIVVSNLIKTGMQRDDGS